MSTRTRRLSGSPRRWPETGVHVDPPFTGRSNLYAEGAGVLVVDREAIDRLNRIDPAITVATLPEYAPVETGRMVATVKIIPFAVSRGSLAPRRRHWGEAIRIAAFRPLRVGLVATTLPSLEAFGDGQDAAASRPAAGACRAQR